MLRIWIQLNTPSSHARDGKTKEHWWRWKRNNCKTRYRVHGEQQGKLLNNITKVFQEKEKEQASNRNRGTETRSHWVIVGCHWPHSELQKYERRGLIGVAIYTLNGRCPRVSPPQKNSRSRKYCNMWIVFGKQIYLRLIRRQFLSSSNRRH